MTVLNVGDKVKLQDRNSWRVQAVTENFAALVRQAPFEEKGTLWYTVIDWRKGIRGPCDLIGQSFGDGSYGEAECAEMLAGFEYVSEDDPARIAAFAAGESSWVPSTFGLEVSGRNNVPIGLQKINGVAV